VSSILRSEYRPIWFFALVVLLIELAAHVLPLYRFERSEAALIESTRNKILSGRNAFRVLIFGDSRSMSLNPRYGTESFKDTYNFSLPAMGPRYYRRYLEKYIEAGNRKPEAILFAGSPLLLMAGKGQALIDPALSEYAQPDMTLLEYLNRRGPERITRIGEEIRRSPRSYIYEELDWSFFSGRYTRMFSPLDVWQDYRGPERLFLISATLPMQFRSYRHREAILNALDPVNYRFQENQHASDACSCDRIYTQACLPPPSFYQDNSLVEKAREDHNGMYNITDRIPPARIAMLAAKDAELKERFFNQSRSVPPVDYVVVEEFLRYLADQNIRYFYLMMPFPEYYDGSPYIRTFEETFTALLKKYPHAKRLRFRTEFLPTRYMPDHVHLNCEGARLINAEFTGIVLPELYRQLDAE
jgi:hypothetical protein